MTLNLTMKSKLTFIIARLSILALSMIALYTEILSDVILRVVYAEHY
jgi:hypothetical protein